MTYAGHKMDDRTSKLMKMKFQASTLPIFLKYGCISKLLGHTECNDIWLCFCHGCEQKHVSVQSTNKVDSLPKQQPPIAFAESTFHQK
jgi:hypothetical protein